MIFVSLDSPYAAINSPQEREQRLKRENKDIVLEEIKNLLEGKKDHLY